MNQIQKGSVRVVNPVNTSQVSSISLLPQDVDIVVFWTKDPVSLFPHLGEFLQRGYDCCFQFTLTPYGKEIEPGVDDKNKVMDRFKSLSDLLGPERVLWRYDPIIFTHTFTPRWHVKQFYLLAKELEGYTKRCTISFLDMYKKIEKDMSEIALFSCPDNQRLDFSSRLADIAHSFRMNIVSCATEEDLSPAGISHGSCIDGTLIESLIQKKVTRARDRGQRPHCGCVKSRDIGTYGTCAHNCRYCYAK